MLQTFRNAWKIEEIRKKILFTLFMILLYRVGNAIPVPYVNVDLLGKYFKQLEKEKHLKNLILVLGAICLVISIFGVWSMISLACLERRREIAVRKVHGAKVSDILSIFTKEYGAVIAISMGAAFITGYLIMHQWMQRFTHQATISWWIYAGIFAATVVVIGLTVIHKVLKTASENPAEVIKSE